MMYDSYVDMMDNDYSIDIYNIDGYSKEVDDMTIDEIKEIWKQILR